MFHLKIAISEHPLDPTPYLRLGQLHSTSNNVTVRSSGLELLRKGHAMAQSQNIKGVNDSLLVETSASFGASAYENSELKSASACMDNLLVNGTYYATDEAMCTKSMIMLRRGQYEEAVRFYQNIGNGSFQEPELLYSEEERERIGIGKGGRRQYYWPKFEREEVGGNLGWVRTMRRPDTMQGAREGYDMDPRHLSR